jgi:hypothetical protein
MTNIVLVAMVVALMVSCGGPPAPPPAAIKQPNTKDACELAISCGVFTVDERVPCVDCLEELARRNKEVLEENEIPPLETLGCEVFAKVAAATNMRLCVDGRWYTRDIP